MGRVWYNYPVGEDRYEWPAGSLPDANSIYSADFLNQFYGWNYYLQKLSGMRTGNKYTCPWVVAGQTQIQARTFWNGLKPLTLGWSAYTKAEITGGTIDNWTAKLVDSPKLSAYPLPDIVTGQDINPYNDDRNGFRQWLLNLRRRIDMCEAFYVDMDGVTKSGTFERWWISPSGNGHTTSDYPSIGGLEATSRAWSDVQKQYDAYYLNSLSLVPTDPYYHNILGFSVGAAVMLYQNPLPAANTLHAGAFPDLSADQAVAIASTDDCGTEWAALGKYGASSPGYIDPDPETYPPTVKGDRGYLGVMLLPCDELPEDFTPP